jgi:hypothetical protein
MRIGLFRREHKNINDRFPPFPDIRPASAGAGTSTLPEEISTHPEAALLPA